MEKTIAIDFDATIHKYKGWNEGKLDAPIDGAMEGIEKLIRRGFKVVIFTTRDADTVKLWMHQYGFPELEVTAVKPPAVAYLDDRAVLFTGRWTTQLVDEVSRFRAYWEQ